jgi:hypothetical protein
MYYYNTTKSTFAKSTMPQKLYKVMFRGYVMCFQLHLGHSTFFLSKEIALIVVYKNIAKKKVG